MTAQPVPFRPQPQGPSSLQKVEIQGEIFAGPLPHPDILERYEQILPGSSERLFKVFETQSAHRQKLESTHVAEESGRATRGQIFGFLIALAVLGIAGLAIEKEYVLTGGFIATFDLSTLVGVFVYGQRTKRAEMAKRSKPQE